MTVIERIKEIEELVNDISPGTQFPKRWCPENTALPAAPIRNDFDFLLKAFKVMRSLSKEKLDECGWLGDLDQYFEKEMGK